MKNWSSAVPALLSALVIVVGLPALAAPDWTPEQKEIIAVMDEWEKAYHSGNAAKIGDILADEIDFTSSSLKGTFRDKTSYLEAYKKWYAGSRAVVSPTSTSITYQEIKVSGDEASVTRKIDWSRRGDRGVQQGTNTKTARLKKINGEWKIGSEK